MSGPWAEFWADTARRGSAATGGGCLPHHSAALEAAQRAEWSGFAEKLPRSARLLDLASGDGRVLKWLLARRRDLKLTGVDLAPELPQAPRGTRLRGGIAMEALPFPDDRFHAVTSQFGIEYSDLARSAAEIARVLRTDGRVALLVHRCDGPILEHNKQRAQAIGWALDEERVLARMETALTMGPSGLRGALTIAALATRTALQRFDQRSPGWEIAEAARRTVATGPPAALEPMVATLRAIARQARNELARIDALERACIAADDRERFVHAFATAGLELRAAKAVREPSGRAFANFLSFS
ncbi:MAG: class I SAM-dependent methyltransferase [Alphaproteobacteria bacterium]|nr:class I SAM-dependent methyltransferase [Alphaproteobacteria bacterium]